MKKTMFVIVMVLVAGLVATGCIQNSRNTIQPSSPGSLPAGSGTQTVASGASTRHHNGSGILSNTTLMKEVAANMGVSEEELQQALNTTETGGDANLTAVAQQLGVTL